MLKSGAAYESTARHTKAPTHYIEEAAQHIKTTTQHIEAAAQYIESVV